MNPPPAMTEGAGRKSSPTTVLLHGRRLFGARLASVVLAALSMGLFVASVPVAYEQLSTVCKAAGCWLFPKDAKVLEESGLSVGSYAAFKVALSTVSVLGYWAIGAILFWKSSGHRVALYASVALVTFGTVQADTLYWLAEAYPVWDLPIALVYFVGEASFGVLFYVFPDGRFVPRWTRWAAVVWITYWLLDSFFPDWPLVIRAPLLLCLIGSVVVAQIYRYRRVSEDKERQQTKWVVFGFTAMIAAFVVVLLIALIFARIQPGIPQFLIYDLSVTTLSLFALVIPLSIGVAILHHHLWDIDLIIRHSLVIGSLSAVLTAMFSITDTLLQSLFFFTTGVEQSRVATFASVIFIAVVFQPLRHRIEGGVNSLVDRLVGGDRTSESLR